MLNRLLFSKGGEEQIKLTINAVAYKAGKISHYGYNSTLGKGTCTPNSFVYKGTTFIIMALAVDVILSTPKNTFLHVKGTVPFSSMKLRCNGKDYILSNKEEFDGKTSFYNPSEPIWTATGTYIIEILPIEGDE